MYIAAQIWHLRVCNFDTFAQYMIRLWYAMNHYYSMHTYQIDTNYKWLDSI